MSWELRLGNSIELETLIEFEMEHQQQQQQQQQRDELFRILFAVVRDDHPENVFTSMENIMCVLLDETDDISEELLLILLSTLGRRSIQGVSVSEAARKLAMNVIDSRAAKLEPLVKQFLVSSISEDGHSNYRIHYHRLIYDLYRYSPQILSTLIPYITRELLNDQSEARIRTVNLVGELFAIPDSVIHEAFQPIFVEFLKRLTDKDVEVRMTVLDFVKKSLRSNPSKPKAAQIFAALCDRLLDYDENMRKQVVAIICDVACFNPGSVPVETTKLVAERVHDKFVSLETLAVKASANLSHPSESGEFQDVKKYAQSKPELDDWVSGTYFNKGLMSSPDTPVPVLHKAERKYEIGKVSDEEQAKQRKFKGILNKLTPQNFDRLFEQVKELNIYDITTLIGVASQIFDRALTEPIFCEMYANFCQHLASELPDLSVDDEKITFRRLLVTKCQEEFERKEREEQKANSADGEGGSEQSEAVREEMRVKVRRRMLGNYRLIGELYKKRMLTERIMHECIKKVLGQFQKPDEENIEALCKLMSTIGKMIDHPKAKEHMDAYFDIMGQLSNDMKLSLRVRFMLKDAIDLRKNKWQQRRKIEGPKKIEEVHRDAAQERQGRVNWLSHNTSM
ncbi:uncharacterized protein LOC141595910 [Silene latifolia]|uniref:uncharacterized protein LOC141595910 n=1 Tax=Silene latifolia TaxID=37657 RepID=UPI003D7800C9